VQLLFYSHPPLAERLEAAARWPGEPAREWRKADG
jgi:Zn-dependent protease with chaperone function